VVLTVDLTLNDALGLEALQPVRQHRRRHAFDRAAQLAEPGLAAQQVAHDEQGPAIAHDVEGGGDGAADGTA
jgi:hypothetical protein